MAKDDLVRLRHMVDSAMEAVELIHGDSRQSDQPCRARFTRHRWYYWCLSRTNGCDNFRG